MEPLTTPGVAPGIKYGMKVSQEGLGDAYSCLAWQSVSISGQMVGDGLFVVMFAQGVLSCPLVILVLPSVICAGVPGVHGTQHGHCG